MSTIPGFIRRLLLSTDRRELQPDDARIAIAAVLVMAARADESYEAAEKGVIDQVLAQRFGLSALEAAELRVQGEQVESEAIDLFQFTRAIKSAVPLEDRVAIMEALWRVVLADNIRDAHEDALMRQMADRLGLSERESALARQRVTAG